MTPAGARLEARRLRRELWPTLDNVVERAVRARLAEVDLAGPWVPLTEEEAEVASMAGRGVGNKNYPGTLVVRAYDLPVSLIEQLRTTAVRVSEQPLEELHELGLTYNSLDYTKEEQEAREEIVARIYSAPRIVRQALERYGPWPREEHPPSDRTLG
ncbi:hypothetical protein ABT024_04980 [Streptomyces sp. NPDC002812]|uniref:hypothetical protein n=1 Tax=Streptomyces sp. NPDC002812 TaxID=3154434 RepID=UPI003325C766